MPLLFGWLLNGVYLLLLTAVSPILIYRRCAHGKYRHGWSEKLTGRLRRGHPEKFCIWFHAVSVGEVVQLQTVLDDAAIRFPTAELLISVTTDTGYDVARSKYPQHTVSYFPLDFSWAVKRALSSINPDLIVLVELELWPNFILESRRRNIPLALINGRIGEKSFKGYTRIKPLMQRLLSSFEILACQSETYAERLKLLGAPTRALVVTGNIKFDRAQSDRENPKTCELRAAFKIGESEQVMIAGSTQDPEEDYAIEAWLALSSEFSNLRLIVVPRHKERFDDVAALILQKGCSLIRRSETITAATASDVVRTNDRDYKTPISLLDTLGELAACWGLADIAFVGGSLTNRGGQNMIEPAGFGAAVLFGPNTWNFKDIAETLLSRDAAKVVHGPEELRETVRGLLKDPNEAQRMGVAAREFVTAQQGATARTLDLIAAIVSQKTRSDAMASELTSA